MNASGPETLVCPYTARRDVIGCFTICVRPVASEANDAKSPSFGFGDRLCAAEDSAALAAARIANDCSAV